MSPGDALESGETILNQMLQSGAPGLRLSPLQWLESAGDPEVSVPRQMQDSLDPAILTICTKKHNAGYTTGEKYRAYARCLPPASILPLAPYL